MLTKAPEDRERRNRPTALAPYDGGRVAPRPPSGLTAKLRGQWDALWCSNVAQLLDPVVDGPVVVRLFELYALGEQAARLIARDARRESRAQRDLAREIAAEMPDADLIDGALVRIESARRSYNVTVATRVRIATESRMLESQLGLSPRSRLALGVMLLAGRKAMQGAAEADGEADDLDADYS